MKAAIIVFPGSNCDRDIAVSLEKVAKIKPIMVWHKETSLPNCDLVVVPGGFTFGDYLRCGSITANSPIMKDIKKEAIRGSNWSGSEHRRPSGSLDFVHLFHGDNGSKYSPAS